MSDRGLVGRQVVLVSGGFQPNYERGLANGLAANGAQVTLISSDLTLVDTLSSAVRVLNLRRSQSPARPIWAKALNLLRYQLQLWAWLARHRPDVVHMFGLIEPTWLVGRLQGLWLRAVARRYVLTVHNLLPHESHTEADRRRYGRAYRLADCCVVHTPRMADDLARLHGVPRDRIVVMEHGLEPLPAPPQPRSTAPDGTVRLLAFGNLAPYKGLDLLLDALRTLPGHFTLYIAGYCQDDAYRREIRNQLAGHPAAGRVRWDDGYVPEDRVAEVFAQADVLVLPYRQIDQSGVLLQALRHGLPVVAARVGALADRVQGELGLCFAPGDSAALASALLDFAARRQQFSAEAIRSHAARYDWASTVRSLDAAYRG